MRSRARKVLALSIAVFAFAGRSSAQEGSLTPTDPGAPSEPADADRPSPNAAPEPSPPKPAPSASAAPASTAASDSAAGVTARAESPPLAHGTREAETEAPTSWFTRAPLTLASGTGKRRFAVTFYGFIEADFINDTTRSYGDSIGSAVVARKETYEGRVGRTQFSARNTRIGLLFESPEIGGVSPSAVFEGDFFGNQPDTPPRGSEAAYFDSPTFRLRHAYLKLKNDIVDVIAGQTYDVFGWQNYFFPCTVEFLGLPNQLFSRSTQLRLSHTFVAGSVAVDLAVAALRPAQRDSSIPDGNAGLRISFDGWKGITTPGNVGTEALPLSLGVSGVVRRFKVNAFTPPPPQASNEATGWGFSIDALVPVIPGKDANDRGNRLTLTGSFVQGTGIADLLTTGGGATFPTLPNPAQANPPPVYTPNIDRGLVTFDQQGVLHTIDWRAFMVGIQYYLPPTGRVILSLNYTQSTSKNIADLYPRGGAEIELLSRIGKQSRYADVNLFWDVTPAVRIGGSFQYTSTEYIDGQEPHNFRTMGQTVYVF
jgi:hypothetical protein